MGIVRFALRFPHTFYVVAALILFLGVVTIRSMPTDIFPEINIPVVSVIWQYTGLTTPEMEQRVTTYSQYSISSNVTGIKNMEAQTLKVCRSRRFISSRMSTSISPSLKSSRRPTLFVPSCRPAFSRRSSFNSTPQAFLFCN
jgi:multidrug efflux pump subunit AcrB